MKFKKLLIVGIDREKLDEQYWAQISDFAEIIVFIPKNSPDILLELQDADGLLVNFGVSVTKEMIGSASSLKYIGILATAYGKVDIVAAKSRGIPVSNLAGYSTESVAEFIIAAILEHIRGLEIGKQRGRAGNYSEAGIAARELKGSIFGVIGLGSIGRRVAELASGFGATVRYWSRQKKDTSFMYEDVDSLIAEADFISINLAQTSETEGFLNKKRIQSIKKGAVVINTAPMELVDANALAERLGQEDLVFISDHFDEAHNDTVAKLSKFKNCIIYPPIAYITEEARKAKQEMFVGNIRSFLLGSPLNIVNL